MELEPEVWAFDVDGTVIGSIRSDRLRPGVELLLGDLNARGVRCVLWSAGGGDYARRMAEAHEIDGFFGGFYSKQDRGPEGRFATTHFVDGDEPRVFVDDAPDEVPTHGVVIGVSQFMGGNAGDAALMRLMDQLPSVLRGDVERLYL